MRSRFLYDLTTKEVEKYFSNGGKTAFLPVGSIEMHGPHQPLGTDTIIATAFCLRLAENSNGIVLPEIHYTWAGSTDGFDGTISIEPEIVQKTVESIALKVFRMGFKRLVVISVHHGNHYSLWLFVRRIYENYHLPAVYINPYEPFGEDSRLVFNDDYKKSKEASLVLASLNILRKTGLYSEQEMSYEEQLPPLHDSLNNIRPGIVGYFMQDPRQHACPSKYVSIKKGQEFIEKQIKYVLPTLEAIDKYFDYTKVQKNKGWWNKAE